MKYEVLIYPNEIDMEKLKEENVVVNKCEVLINMNDKLVMPILLAASMASFSIIYFSLESRVI